MVCYTSRNCFYLSGEKDRCVCLCLARGCHRSSWDPGLSLSSPSPQKLHQGEGHPCPPAPLMCRQGSCHETDRAYMVVCFLIIQAEISQLNIQRRGTQSEGTKSLFMSHPYFPFTEAGKFFFQFNVSSY